MKIPFRLLLLLTIVSNAIVLNASSHKSKIKVAFTTDVHGNFFPTDYITMSPMEGSLARIITAIDSLRKSPGGENLILLDNGDILQGQPTVYYYNYIDTVSPHIASEVYNHIGFDAITIGNHDIETGHDVYDRWRSLNKMPLLGANVINVKTNQPYFQPYTVINRDGVKVAVLGLLTPAIPAWLPENLWEGLRFEDMVESAGKWVPIIQEKENPDLIIGMFHSGHDETVMTGDYLENASVKVAREVPGFDAVLIGHDHQRFRETIENVEGKKVHVINPSNNARAIGLLEFDVTKSESGELVSKNVSSQILDVTGFNPDSDFIEKFASQREAVEKYVGRVLGYVEDNMSISNALFGPSAFMSLLHQLQLEISGAEISFAAPLSANALIKKGPMRVSDTFTLYKYENMLYVIKMTGKEIKDYLEESYAGWTEQIDNNQPHIINFKSDNPSPSDNRLDKPIYNFDSAAGIDYIVDITKPKGEKIKIFRMSDGRDFSIDSTYTVAINSYRANGGGDLLTKGAKIPHSELGNRIIKATDKDLRYYLIKHIEENPEIKNVIMRNWKFIPEDIAKKAIAIDRNILFSPESSVNQK